MTQLPVVEVNGKRWIVDVRLKEVRPEVIDMDWQPIHFMDIEDPELSEKVSEIWSMASTR